MAKAFAYVFGGLPSGFPPLGILAYSFTSWCLSGLVLGVPSLEFFGFGLGPHVFRVSLPVVMFYVFWGLVWFFGFGLGAPFFRELSWLVSSFPPLVFF